MSLRDQPKYGRYVYKVLKQVHNDLAISAKAVDVMNGLVYNWLHMICAQAGELVRINKKKTMTCREIQTAVRLTISGELRKHAVSEGTKCVVVYSSRIGNYYCENNSNNINNNNANADIPTNKIPFKREKKTRMSKSKRCGLQFPVGRIKTFIRKERYANRIGLKTADYLTAVIEYLVAEVMELAGNAAKVNKKVRITVRHILLAVKNDEELNNLIFNEKGGGSAIMAGGGVVPRNKF